MVPAVGDIVQLLDGVVAGSLHHRGQLIAEGVLDRQDRRQQQVLPLDTEILGDDGLHDLRRSAVDRLDAGVDERA
ncbi:MAG: hypothetical protein QOE94_3532 [Mycobacterium sp.]|jgi:hypothetical protein|nr:hypothetical protein [Mycobacterium sp.]